MYKDRVLHSNHSLRGNSTYDSFCLLHLPALDRIVGMFCSGPGVETLLECAAQPVLYESSQDVCPQEPIHWINPVLAALGGFVAANAKDFQTIWYEGFGMRQNLSE
jgi:hypothetical protein